MRTQPTILITGATDGIGKALAHHYQQQNARLILIGRRTLAGLDRTFFTQDNYCQTDLAQPNCAEQIATWLNDHDVVSVDLLIHNAGVGYVGTIDSQAAENIQQLLAVNLYAPIAISHRLLPTVAAAQGKVVFISSVVANLPSPDYAVYAASKAALDGFVRNLQIELAAAKRDVRAQVIHPGATRTSMHAKSGLDKATVNWARFPPAEKVAGQIAAAIARDRRASTIGLMNGVLKWSGRYLATPVDWAMRQRTVRSSGRTQSLPAGVPMLHAGTSEVSMENDKPHVVITGAADGIGKALAGAFAKEGCRVTGVDVDEERAVTTQGTLRQSGADITFLTADLAAADDIAQLSKELATGPSVDVLIHNAGINAVGHFATMPLDKQLAVLDVNLRAPVLLTADLLRHNKLAVDGTIVVLSSLSHYVGYPGAAVYAASKDGLTSYARSLAIALALHNINTLTVYPGPTRTAHARRYSPDNRRESKRMPPAVLAKRIVDAVNARRNQLIPGIGNRIFARAGRVVPRLTETAMRRVILDKLPTP